MNTIRAIIFDLDGVICFTDQYHYQAWKEMADAEGIYFDETINGRLRGVSRMESLDIILEKASREYTQEEKEQLAARKNESYVRLLEKMSPDDLSQEVKKTLEILRQRGYKLAIGSSSKNTKKILTQITPYMYHYYIEALLKCGDKTEALSVMEKYWGGMARLGADTFWELYNPNNPDESPYGGTIVNSYCHAWSCAPAYFLRKYYSEK